MFRLGTAQRNATLPEISIF